MKTKTQVRAGGLTQNHNTAEKAHRGHGGNRRQQAG